MNAHGLYLLAIALIVQAWQDEAMTYDHALEALVSISGE